MVDYLTDASNMGGGFAVMIKIPESEDEVSEILSEAYSKGIPVTVSGARTGTVGGAVPRGGWVVSLEKLKGISVDTGSKTIKAGAAELLADVQREAERHKLFYPPDPTEWSCQIGGNVATDASGARSFKYGSTRNFVEAIRVVLANGDTLSIKRGRITAENGKVQLQTDQGNVIEVKIPTYERRDVRKDTSGFFVEPEVDAIDLFIGSEGILGVITGVELRLLDKPEGFLSGIVFFDESSDILSLVAEVKELSAASRKSENGKGGIDATLVEYFDKNSLDFIGDRFPDTPADKAGAIFFEQETNSENEDELFGLWNDLLEKHNADVDSSWFAVNEQDKEKMVSFRHALPLAVNEKIVKYGQRKVGTDMAVPDRMFPLFLEFCRKTLDESRLEYVIFGHIGDNHLHANMIPKNEEEAVTAKHIYGRMIAQSLMFGGTISAEHGIGKLKSNYLYVMYGERYINEMAELKHAFDVKNILGRGNMFDEKFLAGK